MDTMQLILLDMKQIRIFVRNFLKNVVTGSLSILSLSIGVAVALLLGTWAFNEFQFDKQHKNPEEVYRICRKGFLNNESVQLGSVFAPLGKEVKKSFPEVVDMARVYRLDSRVLKVGNVKQNFENIHLVDSTFFNIFNFDVEQSAIDRFLSTPNSILLTDELSKKLYGRENPVGKIIACEGNREIVGVIKGPHFNTHLDIAALMPMASVGWADNRDWGNSDSYITYVRLARNTSVAELEKKITSLAVKNFPPYEQIKLNHFLQPLTDIHFSSGFRFDFVKKSSAQLVYTFIAIALVILLLATVNFVNLFISTSFSRAKAIGVKKTNGAKKWHLIFDFFSETFMYVFVSLLVGVLLAQIALPVFNGIIDYKLSIDYTGGVFYLFLITLLLLVTLMAGSFPAYQMSKFNAIQILKDQFKGKKLSVVQKTLIVTQFAASIVLLISVLIIKEQLVYMTSIDLGFDKENVLYVRMNGAFANQHNRIEQELERNAQVQDITVKASGTPIEWRNGSPISLADKKTETYIMEMCNVEDNYFDFLKMPIVEGTGFVEGESGRSCILNEEAVKTLKLDDPIGKVISRFGNELVVKGVVKSAYTKSLHDKIDPQVYAPISGNEYGWSVMMVKTTGNSKSVVDYLRQEWEKLNPDQPFEYNFLDKSYEELYKADAKAGKVVSWAVAIALLITIAGLWGMANYAITRRTKEVGVRKVNGATIAEILTLLNKDFVIWIVVSFAIACPIGAIVMNRWLEAFSLKTTMHWWIFLLAGIIPLGIALAAVSWKSWKTATSNPVKALRYE
ncbi:FtsX-like permease family protein [Prolixibacteraceae bacterium JC049]|nr:FtsX-like permease family protein [Prolixibacteraceae bacterium JC049]